MDQRRHDLIETMRNRVGSRQKFATRVGVSLNTAKDWEDKGRPPEGQSLARLVLMFPDLADDLLRSIAAGEDFDPSDPPVYAPVISPESAVEAMDDGMRGLGTDDQPQTPDERRQTIRREVDSPPRA